MPSPTPPLTPSLPIDLLRTYGRLITNYRLLQSHPRIEALLITDRAILVFGTDRTTTEAAALDIADFHEASRHLPILPIILPNTLNPRQRIILQRPLPFPGATPPILCTRLLLPTLLDHVAAFPPIPGFDPTTWETAPYRPVPALIDAACRLYANHDVASLLITTSGRGDLARTRQTVQTLLAEARSTHGKRLILITGAPGAGKTLCGLDLAFTPQPTPAHAATFLTGNPALVHVLRAALIRDAATRGLQPRAARQRIDAILKPLHHFRDHHAPKTAPPAERIIVIDEAQRCWTAPHALRKTRNRAHPLQSSEPALLLDIMARHEGFAAIICLLGGGQEIHAGEGGLATWSEALATRPEWQTAAPPEALETPDPRQRLAPSPTIHLNNALRLGAPIRAWRAPRVIAWIDAVLANDAATARRLASPDLPIRLTRSLQTMRAALRAAIRAQPPRRAGLLATAGARRLRAEGIGGLLWHQDEDAVATWFLESWPDIRSADALEVAATEFGAQGLELDETGLCWDTDLARTPDGTAWQARAFRATAWTLPKDPETLSNRLNAYRVLLTRARRRTIIWVPRGDPLDPTRNPSRYDAIAFFLQSCGAPLLDPDTDIDKDTPMPDRPLL